MVSRLGGGGGNRKSESYYEAEFKLKYFLGREGGGGLRGGGGLE